MAKTLSARARRCRSFLRALAAGGSVTDACKASELGWATLYRWRRKDAAFRAAWDEAMGIGAEARIVRLDDELMRRAVDGIDDPIMHNGEQVATRKRYSDPLLMFAIRELRGRRQSERERAELDRAEPDWAERRRAELPPPAPGVPNAESRITVVVRQFGAPAEKTAPETPALPAPREQSDD